MKNKIQLITYPDSLGGTLQGLHRVLQAHFQGLCDGGVHILPPFPASGDRGFAPLTYLSIEPAFGTWEDIEAIAQQWDVALDVMVNHISAQSPYFQDFLEKGRGSQWADLFLTLDKIWPDGQPQAADVAKVFLRRPLPYSPYQQAGTGEDLTVWTTFGPGEKSEQIDLDIHSEKTRALLTAFLEHFAQHKVRQVRLDAVGFVIKRRGTSCFFVKPDIYAFLDWIAGVAGQYGIDLLPEVHGEPAIARELTEHGYTTYDFVLPYTVLDCLLRRDSKDLYAYLANRPQGLFTMLDCHDGLPVKPDLNGFYRSHDAHRLVQTCEQRGALFSRILSKDHQDPDGFDVHQICGTFYALVGHDNNAYLAARAIQFFVPGIPQVYYVGLLAGKNDPQRAAETGDRREINRHNYTEDQVAQAVAQPVFQRLAWLMRLRNTHPAFDGDFQAEWLGGDKVRLAWQKGEDSCTLTVDLASAYHAQVKYTQGQGQMLERLL